MLWNIGTAINTPYGIVGGIGGRLEDGNVENCKNEGYVYGNWSTMSGHGITGGGIVGLATSSTISKCSNSKQIYYYSTEKSDNNGALGRICGLTMSSSIEQCYNKATVTSKFITGNYTMRNVGE